jgi:hypothetical protein
MEMTADAEAGEPSSEPALFTDAKALPPTELSLEKDPPDKAFVLIH